MTGTLKMHTDKDIATDCPVKGTLPSKSRA